MSISAMKQEGWVLREVYFSEGEPISHREPQPVAWFIQYEYRHEFLWREPTAYEKNSALEVKPLYTAPVHAIDMSQEPVDETAKDRHEPDDLYDIWVEHKEKTND